MSYCPPQVSEVPDLPVEDCAPSSDLMAANKGSGGGFPANRAERERIRTATGKPHGGLTVADLNRANRTLYGHELEVLSISFETFLARYMAFDYGAVLLGTAANLPVHYNRWDPGFKGGHAVFVQGPSPSGVRRTGFLWWMNPLAPWDYPGEWIPADAARAYAWGIGQSGLVQEGSWATSGGPIDVAGCTFNATANSAGGTVSVVGSNHSYIRNRDQALIPVAAGFTKPVLARGTLVAPNRGPAYLVGDELAYLLAVDVSFTPPAPQDCSAEIAQDRTKAYVAYKP